MENTRRHEDLISGFANKTILVIGDFMLDVYLKGSSTRLCPEAPVPVVDICEKSFLPGGAGNTVRNLKALGARVIFCSVIGADPEGDEAMRLMKELGADTDTVIRQPGRKTLTKTRVMAGSQVIARVDEGSKDAVDETTTEALVAHITKCYPECDALVLSDYNKGVITNSLLKALGSLKQRHPRFIAVDSKRLPFFAQLAPACAKPNYFEAVSLLGLPAQPTDRTEQIVPHGEKLLQMTGARLVSVTLDGDGSLILRQGKPSLLFPAPSITRPSVAGAGDTYLSAFVLAYISSNDALVAAEVGTAAATIAIRKEGTSSCSQQELKSHFHVHAKYVATLRDLADISEAYRREGKRIVFTNGCFDILHSGHVTYLHRARELGDVLIVGLNTDESIGRIKRSKRPINSLMDRLQVLAGLSSVDHIVPFGDEIDDTPVPVIRVVRPDIFAKGGDYRKENLPEAATVEACGGRIVFLEHVPHHSTTRIINRINRMLNSAAHEPVFHPDNLEKH